MNQIFYDLSRYFRQFLLHSLSITNVIDTTSICHLMQPREIGVLYFAEHLASLFYSTNVIFLVPPS
jgi:hypothetical protein